MMETQDAQRLRISIDYGTKTLQICYSGQEASTSTIRDISFKKGLGYAHQEVAWDRAGESHWGDGINAALKKGLIVEDDIIELWKLALYDDHKTTSIAQDVQAKLGNRTMHDLLVAHLEAIVKYTVEFLTNDIRMIGHSASEIDGLPIEVLLSVPQMWKPPANKRMTDAAKAANIARVELAYEPQSAMALYFDAIKDQLPKTLSLGHVLLVADIGGGTGDFVSYRLESDPKAGANMRLSMAAEPQGALCGGQFVTMNFLAWMEAQAPQGIEHLCQELGISRAAARRSARDQFDPIKHDFSFVGNGLYRVHLYPSTAKQRSPAWQVTFSDVDIATWFNPVVGDICRCIENQPIEDAKAIIMPGGTGASEFLVEGLKERYGHLKIVSPLSDAAAPHRPVVRGALLRYHDISNHGFPSKGAFGIARVEEFDPYKHPDACLKGVARGRSVRREALLDPKLVETDGYHPNVWVVYERWMPLTRKGQVLASEDLFITEVWQQAYIYVDDLELTQQIFWTDTDIAEHDAMLDGMKHADCQDARYKPGIEKWGAPLSINLSELPAKGFEAKESEDGEVYEIYYKLVLQADGANISIRAQVAMPGAEPYTEKGRRRDIRVELTGDQVFDVVEASYNPVPRSSAGF